MAGKTRGKNGVFTTSIGTLRAALATAEVHLATARAQVALTTEQFAAAQITADNQDAKLSKAYEDLSHVRILSARLLTTAENELAGSWQNGRVSGRGPVRTS